MSRRCNNCKMVELAYRKGQAEGFTEGQRQGRKDGSTLVKSDLEWFHARMCLALKKKRNWKDETIEQFLKQLEDVGQESPNVFRECEELTGLVFRQYEEGEEIDD